MKYLVKRYREKIWKEDKDVWMFSSPEDKKFSDDYKRFGNCEYQYTLIVMDILKGINTLLSGMGYVSTDIEYATRHDLENNIGEINSEDRLRKMYFSENTGDIVSKYANEHQVELSSVIMELMELQLKVTEEYLRSIEEESFVNYRISMLSTYNYDKTNQHCGILADILDKYNYPKVNEYNHDFMKNDNTVIAYCKKEYIKRSKSPKYYNNYGHMEVFKSIFNNLSKELSKVGYMDISIQEIEEGWCFGSYIIYYRHLGSRVSKASITARENHFRIDDFSRGGQNELEFEIIFDILREYVDSEEKFLELYNSDIKDLDKIKKLADEYGLISNDDFVEFPNLGDYSSYEKIFPLVEKEYDKVSKLNVGDKISLKSNRSNSTKVTEYKILGKNRKGMMAVEETNTKKKDRVIYIDSFDTLNRIQKCSGKIKKLVSINK